jgi:predicted transcriptional regulator
LQPFLAVRQGDAGREHKERKTSNMKNLVAPLVLCVAFLLPSAVSRPARAAKHVTNACGCYGDGNACFCEKKAKCGCPGECEPKGCEEERQKKLQKEIDEETRKAKEVEKEQVEKAQNKAKEEAAKASKDSDEDQAATAAPEKGKGKGKPVRKMTSVQKKQFQKLIDAYLAEHPDEAQRSLTEVRGDL